MNDLSQYSQYHPSWDGQDFTQQEFASLLDDLSKKKPDEALLTDGKSIRIAGIAMQLWQTIKGWLGLENQIDPIKVNYDLLKLMRYGETHHFFSDSQIKAILNNFVRTLNRDADHSFDKIANIIQKILPIENDTQAATHLDLEVRTFYTQHKDQLHEPFWINLFQKHTAPVHQDAARLHFNEANIHSREERFSEAIACLEKALEINPGNSLWQINLAQSLINNSETQSTGKALRSCRKALNILKNVVGSESQDMSLKGLGKFKSEAYLKCAVLNVKLENYDQAIGNLTELRELENNPKTDAFYFTLLADRYELARDYKLSLMELKNAYASDPSPDIAERIKNLALQLANQTVEDKTAEPHAYLEKTQDLLPTDTKFTETKRAEEPSKDVMEITIPAGSQRDELESVENEAITEPTEEAFNDVMETVIPAGLQPYKPEPIIINDFTKPIEEDFNDVMETVIPAGLQPYKPEPIIINDFTKPIEEDFNDVMETVIPAGLQPYKPEPIIINDFTKPIEESLNDVMETVIPAGLQPYKPEPIIINDFTKPIEESLNDVMETIIPAGLQPYKPEPIENDVIAKLIDEALKDLLETAHDAVDEKDESQITQANLMLSEGRFSEALDLFQKLALSNPNTPYRDKIHACHLGIAALNEKIHPAKAISSYEESIPFATAEQKQATALKLLYLGFSLVHSGQSILAAKSYQSVLETAQDLSLLPQTLLFEAYLTLARSKISEKNYAEASDLYQTALKMQPNQVDTILEIAEFHYSQGALEKAALGFRQTMMLRPHVSAYKRRLLAAEMDIGDKYYAKGTHDPQRVSRHIVDLITLATTSDFSQKIEYALGAWRGKNSADNVKLIHIGENAKETPHEIAIDGNRACEILEKAYDGGRHHMYTNEMPQELREKIDEIRREIALMGEYYETLQEKTEEVITAWGSTSLAANFQPWIPIPKIVDPEESQAIENQSETTLKFLQNCFQANPTAFTPIFQQQIKNLRQLSMPFGWMQAAIQHYRSILELNPDFYGEHCNKLIDAYTQIGDYTKAITTYEQLKSTFPNALLQIDHAIYVNVVENPETQMQIRPREMFDGLIRAGDQFSRLENYDKAIQTYNKAITFASPKQKAEIFMRLVHLGDKLMNTASKQEAISAYESVIPYLNLLQLSPAKQINIFNAMGSAGNVDQDFQKMVGFYEQALALNPDNEITNAALGSIYFLHNEPEQALSYYEKAFRLNPSNENYIHRMAEIEIAVGDLDYIKGSLSHLNQSLRNFIRYVTAEAPYASDIVNALGANLKSFSAENRKLQNLGTTALSLNKLEADCLKALDLILSAYNGKRNHKKPDEIPEDLISQVSAFSKQLSRVQSLRLDFPQLFQDIRIIPGDLFNYTQSAISNYEKASTRLPMGYKDHYNRLIDAYIQQGEPAKAQALYKLLKRKFPNSPLQNPFKREDREEAKKM